MITAEDRTELVAYLDMRYKKKEDCDADMQKVADDQAANRVEIALINQQLKIIRWVTTTTLGALICGLVGVAIAAIIK